MATQAHQSAAIKLEGNQITAGGGPGGGQLLISPNRQHAVELEDGSVETLPLGTSFVVTKRRMAGDWYAEIKGARHVAGVGADQGAALRAAIAKAA